MSAVDVYTIFFLLALSANVAMSRARNIFRKDPVIRYSVLNVLKQACDFGDEPPSANRVVFCLLPLWVGSSQIRLKKAASID